MYKRELQLRLGSEANSESAKGGEGRGEGVGAKEEGQTK